METYAGETTKLDGKNTEMSFTAKLDGTGSPVTGNPMGDTIAIKHPSPSKVVATIRKGWQGDRDGARGGSCGSPG